MANRPNDALAVQLEIENRRFPWENRYSVRTENPCVGGSIPPPTTSQTIAIGRKSLL